LTKKSVSGKIKKRGVPAKKELGRSQRRKK